jgi:hypothetical protein
MQWDNARSFLPSGFRDYGGIVIPKPAAGQNPQIRLFRKTGDNPRQIIGSSLPTVNAPGGKWFFLWVRQILGDGVKQQPPPTPSISDPVDRPINYVWYSDGAQPQWILYNHDEPNAITGGRVLAADRVRYGAVEYSGTNPLDVKFDCAAITGLCP